MDATQLATVPLLASLTDDELAMTAEQFEVTHLDAETTVIAQGEPSPGLFVVLNGEVVVEREVDGETRDMAVLGPHTVFGEMSLVDGSPAQATVRTRTEATLALLPRARLDLLDRLPQIRAGLVEVSLRRQASNRVAELQPVRLETRAGQVRLRPMWPDDWRLMEAGRHRMSDESLRRRFFTLPKLSEYMMRRLANVDWADHFAWAVLQDVDGDGADDLAAVGRYARMSEDASAAELALLVADDVQGQGLGTLLMGALAIAADHHGLETFVATALSDNEPVQTLLTRFGATWSAGSRGQEVSARWPVAAALDATPATLRTSLEPLVGAVLDPLPADGPLPADSGPEA